MKVALFQPPYSDAETTMDFLRHEMERHVAGGYDLFLLPEYSNCSAIENAEELGRFIDGKGREFLTELRDFSRRNRIAVAAGVVERDPSGHMYNRLRLWDPECSESAKIDKVHLTGTEHSWGLTPGEQIETMTFRTFRIGGLICFDIYFPEHAIELGRRKVDIILAPSYQRGESADRIRLLAAGRALDAGAWLLRSSYAVNDSERFAGRSLAASPTGEIAASLAGSAGVLAVTIEPGRKFLKPASFGEPPVEHRTLIAAHRRPSLYRETPAWFATADRPRLCAHRGLSRAMPENTLGAFAAAIAAGAHEIEFDVFCAADRTAVVSHDPDLTRVAGIPRHVEEMTWPEIRGLNLGKVYGPQWNGFRIARLEEVLDLVAGGDVGLNIHLKTPGPDGILLRILEQELIRRNLLDQAYVGGEADVLEAALALAEQIPRSCMAEQNNPEKLVDHAIRYRCRYLQFFTNFRPEDVARAHAAGIRCNLFFADDYISAAAAVEAGIDTVLSNVVPELLAAPGSIFAWNRGS